MNVLKTEDLSGDLISEVFRDANLEFVRNGNKKIVAMLFFEPSTRTRLSFETAAHKIGSQVITIADGATSSTTKGESVADTVKTVSQYADIIVMRHPDANSVREAAKVSDCPIINAGNGAEDHPTQALLDVFTVLKEKGTFKNLKILVSGDLLYGRAARAFINLMSKLEGNEIWLNSPLSLRHPDYLKYKLCANALGSPNPTVKEVAKIVDVVYMSRIQKDRAEINEKHNFIITPEVVKTLKDEAIIMSPLPRNDEISPLVDADKRAVYFNQVKYGVNVRAALLNYLLIN